MSDTTVFVVSKDFAVRDSLSELVASAGLRAETFPSLKMWLETLQSKPRGCLVLDAQGRDFTVAERLARLTAACSELAVLMLVDRGDVPIAVRGIKEGAIGVLEKPLRDENLLERIKMAAAAGSDTEANRSLLSRLRT
jgi:FixJ family two-component response regulator